MTEKNIAVFGIYLTRASVDNAVETLKEAGFAGTDISVLFDKNVISKYFAHVEGTQPPEDGTASKVKGAIGGAAVGGLFAGVTALAIPALAPLVLVGAGPVMLILAELAAGDASAGVEHALIGIGIPEYEAKHYGLHIKNGAVFLCVHADNSRSAQRAKDILERTQAQDIVVSGESFNAIA